MFLIVFDHANACANMHSLVKIHNTKSCPNLSLVLLLASKNHSQLFDWLPLSVLLLTVISFICQHGLNCTAFSIWVTLQLIPFFKQLDVSLNRIACFISWPASVADDSYNLIALIWLSSSRKDVVCTWLRSALNLGRFVWFGSKHV